VCVVVAVLSPLRTVPPSASPLFPSPLTSATPTPGHPPTHAYSLVSHADLRLVLPVVSFLWGDHNPGIPAGNPVLAKRIVHMLHHAFPSTLRFAKTAKVRCGPSRANVSLRGKAGAGGGWCTCEDGHRVHFAVFLRHLFSHISPHVSPSLLFPAHNTHATTCHNPNGQTRESKEIWDSLMALVNRLADAVLRYAWGGPLVRDATTRLLDTVARHCVPALVRGFAQ
jgi:hypothetical protein